jgi:eukaryotic-like serine/threonine-protein kinase
MISSPIYCTNCGAANSPQAKFCFGCGQALQSGVTVSAAGSLTGLLVYNQELNRRYRIIKQVGKGGFGAVYMAADLQFGNRLVAIKEMSQSGLSQQNLIEATNAFTREALMLASLTHSNLPRIYEQFTESGRWYLVMDFIEGETLEDYLNKAPRGYLPLTEALDIGIQLCTVLDYLHTRFPPIIFRDLKPANVMRTPSGHLYLIDFGIARHFKPGQTADTIALGSPGYAAREQYSKAQTQTTQRSDIYSLGATLHQLLTGDDPSLMPFQFAPLHSQPVPAALETLIMQMVELDARDRPTSMAYVKQELQRIAALSSIGRMYIAQPKGQPTYPSTSPLVKSAKSPATYVKAAPPAITRLVTYRGHSKEVYAVCWSPGGKFITSGSGDETVQVWDAASGTNVLNYHGHSHRIGKGLVQALMWSPDGKYIVSGSWDKSVRIWDASTGHTISTYRSYYEVVEAVAWSPDGKYIASGNRNGTAHVWDVATGKNIRNFLGHCVKEANVDVVAIAWSPDSKRVASASWDRTVKVWNAIKNSGKKNDYLIFRGHTAEVNTLAWSPDGTRIASGGRDDLVHVWDSSNGGLLLSYNGHKGYVVGVAWSPDGTRIASAGADRTVQVWNAATGKYICTYPGHTARVNAVAWSPDSKYIVSCSNDKTVQVWLAL